VTVLSLIEGWKVTIPPLPVIPAQTGIHFRLTRRFHRTACHYGFPPPRE